MPLLKEEWCIIAPTTRCIANANFSIFISRDLKLAAGDKVKISVSDDIFGLQYLASDKSFFSGHLATKY